jgi:hypothetical protein
MQFKTLGVTEEGRCDRCGTNCPKRRIAVQPVDADGNACGDVQAWGCNCAAFARYGSKSVRHQNAILAEADNARRERECLERGWLSRAVTVGESVVLWIPNTGRSFLVDPPKSIDEAKSLANRKYNARRSSLVGSYFAQRGESTIVRVDGNRLDEAAFFESQGFVRVSEPVKEVC